MKDKEIKHILNEVSKGGLSVDEAISILKILPYKNLEYAKVDHHRSIRCAHPETILAKGKTIDQILGIAKELANNSHNIMITKASSEIYRSVRLNIKKSRYYEKAEMIVINPKKSLMTSGKILVITAGTCDIKIAEEVAVTANTMGSVVEKLYDVGIAGIHRLIDNYKIIESANVLVVVAGMDGALPSVIAGLTNRLVIAVPTSFGYGSNFFGLAPLLTMLNTCSNGVVTVNIDNGYGAGYSAAIINNMAGSF